MLILVAVITGVFGLVSIWLQFHLRQSARRQETQHGESLALMRAVKADVVDIKADVRDLRDADRSHEERLRRLERP